MRKVDEEWMKTGLAFLCLCLCVWRFLLPGNHFHSFVAADCENARHSHGRHGCFHDHLLLFVVASSPPKLYHPRSRHSYLLTRLRSPALSVSHHAFGRPHGLFLLQRSQRCDRQVQIRFISIITFLMYEWSQGTW